MEPLDITVQPNASVLIDMPLPDHSDDNAHFRGPSSLLLFADGNWTISIGETHNDRRTSTFPEYGPAVAFIIRIDFLTANGSVVFSSEYNCGREGYGGKTYRKVTTGLDPQVPARINQFRRMMVYMSIRETD